jgi:transposase InsO family protein
MDFSTKWSQAYVIPKQDASTVAEARITNIVFPLLSTAGRNFGSRPMQEILQRLGMSKLRTTPLHLQSDGMVERYIKTVEEHLRKVSSPQRDWDARLPVILLAYRAFTRYTTGLTSASPLFGRELLLPCDLLFGALPDKERPTVDHAINLVDHLHDIHSFSRQHLKLASDRMKTCYNRLVICADCH